jgi:glycosyltransferase involved in cell wall biosynthesis
MSSPRVTVIIATYNWSTVLPFAIGSVLGQTLADFELLVVGDGCTDDSEQVVSAIRDPRVRWINLASNTGHQSGPNNRGLEEARGEFIAYLGHDDLWLEHHLECSVAGLERAAADISHTLLMRVMPESDVGLPVLPKPELRQGGPPSCRVHRRCVSEKIGGWRDYRSLRMAPEMDFFLRAQEAGFTPVFVPRLTAIKFPASRRKDAYRDRPSHEQRKWSQRIASERDFENAQLVRMIEAMSNEVPQQMPVRKLFETIANEIAKRAAARFKRGLAVEGAEVDRFKKFKGV